MMRTMKVALAAGVFLWPLAAFGAGPVTYQSNDQVQLAALQVGDFKPGTLERGPIDVQTPAIRRLVTGLSLRIGTGGDSGCGDSDEASLALLLPNGLPATTTDCIFAAGLTVSTERGPQQIDAQCDVWRNDVSVCSMDGDTGAFSLRRRTSGNGTLDVIFGRAPDPDVATASVVPLGKRVAKPVISAQMAPSRSVMLGSVIDDEGRAISDTWLLPQSEVTVGLKRE